MDTAMLGVERTARSPVNADEEWLPRTIGHAASDYRNLFGWPVTHDDRTVSLRMTADTAGIVLDSAVASEVSHCLALRSSLGPVMAIPDLRASWVFLGAADIAIPQQTAAPAGVRFIVQPMDVLLPPSITPTGPVQWVVTPNRARCWLPTFTALLAAVRNVRGLRWR